jgi:hypothetical protein
MAELRGLMTKFDNKKPEELSSGFSVSQSE